MTVQQRGITVGGVFVASGERVTVELPAASLYSHAPMNLPVQVVCGRRDGPTFFVSAAVHGDEINGVEIIRRLLKLPLLDRLRGTLLAIPIVNVYGFVSHSRYLPDRRDLNRSFPGSDRGSLAARLADLFLSEIVDKSNYGIDLHTGAGHRENLPQIRANLEDLETARIARAFNVPVMLNTTLRDGSLREMAAERGIPMLLYEAGEASRFDERSIRAGVKGIVSVMREIQMLPTKKSLKPRLEPMLAQSNTWVRAGQSGILRISAPLGGRVRKGEVLGVISDPFGEREIEVKASTAGIIIGRTKLPLVNEGEAICNIATFESAKAAESAVEAFHSEDMFMAPIIDQEPPII